MLCGSRRDAEGGDEYVFISTEGEVRELGAWIYLSFCYSLFFLGEVSSPIEWCSVAILAMICFGLWVLECGIDTCLGSSRSKS